MHAVRTATLVVSDSYSSVEGYAGEVLDLHPVKVRELLRAFRALRNAPIMSEAFRQAELSWTKVRELTRHLTGDNDQDLTEWGKSHTNHEVRTMGVVTAGAWRRQADSSAAGQQSNVYSDTLDIEWPPDNDDADAGNDTTPVEPMTETTSDVQGDLPLDDVGTNRPPAPPPTLGKVSKKIPVTHYLSPDEFALYEQVRSRVMSTKGKRVSQAAVLMEICRRYMASGSAQSRVMHPVHVHVHAETRAAWYETERGPLPASLSAEEMAAVVDGAKEEQPETTSREAAPRRSRVSRRIPTPTLRALQHRAAGKCESCGSPDRLQVDHIEPFTDTHDHRLENLRLLCKDCHDTRHVDDFIARPDWQQARARAKNRSAEPRPMGVAS